MAHFSDAYFARSILADVMLYFRKTHHSTEYTQNHNRLIKCSGFKGVSAGRAYLLVLQPENLGEFVQSGVCGKTHSTLYDSGHTGKLSE